MFYKFRTKPKDLKVLEVLNYRMNLTSKDRQHYLNLKRGYEGELIFDSFTEKLQCECLLLNDLLLEVNNTTFQIDTLLIMQEKICFYEVKYYEGDYFYESEKLFKKKPKLEVINPLDQLSRSETLLRQLIQSLGHKLPIVASVVFINPNFTLYQAPLNKPIIFPTQIKNYFSNLNTISSKLSARHKELADQLLAMHITDSPYQKLPIYKYEELLKGIICPKCHLNSMSVEKRTCVCRKCEYKEPVSNSIFRSVKEFKILFPNKKITTNKIHDWCQKAVSQKSIKHILSKNYQKVGTNRWTYYK
ncbi:NERD domain-containing protein [Sutcliffiella cohnii]